MDKTTPVGQIMTADVITVAPNDTMDKIRDIFNRHPIHHVPVQDNGKVVGIISETDYLKLVNTFTVFRTTHSEAYNDALLHALLVREVMTRQVATIYPEDSVEIAAGYFRENLFRALPVVNRNGALVGIVTTYDLLNFAFS
jgi:acetoin utilization protein AcuB